MRLTLARTCTKLAVDLLATKFAAFGSMQEYIKDINRQLDLLRATGYEMDSTMPLLVAMVCKDLPPLYYSITSAALPLWARSSGLRCQRSCACLLVQWDRLLRRR